MQKLAKPHTTFLQHAGTGIVEMKVGYSEIWIDEDNFVHRDDGVPLDQREDLASMMDGFD